jgi:2-keto-4-pentenoate hydratase
LSLTQTLADELVVATRDRITVAPLTARFPDLTLDDAYEIQLAQQRVAEASGRVLVGRKIGLTSAAMQQQLGIDSPDFGYFFDDMVYRDGDTVPISRFIAPRIEPEFAFVLGNDLVGPGVTIDDARRSVAQVLPALEIIDSRIADWKIKLVDTVADNASCGAIVLGPELDGVDPAALSEVECSLVLDHQVVRIGYGRDVLGDPMAALAWLANTLGERGVVIAAGQTVLPGAFVAAATVTAGSIVSADFGALGSVTVTFES